MPNSLRGRQLNTQQGNPASAVMDAMAAALRGGTSSIAGMGGDLGVPRLPTTEQVSAQLPPLSPITPGLDASPYEQLGRQAPAAAGAMALASKAPAAAQALRSQRAAGMFDSVAPLPPARNVAAEETEALIKQLRQPQQAQTAPAAAEVPNGYADLAMLRQQGLTTPEQIQAAIQSGQLRKANLANEVTDLLSRKVNQ